MFRLSPIGRDAIGFWPIAGPMTVAGSSGRLADAELDGGLTLLDTVATAIHICSAAPSNYAGVTSLTLGNKTFSAGAAVGAIAANSTTGRQVTTTAFTDGVVTGSGVATHVAVTTGSVLYAVVELNRKIAIPAGSRVFTLPSFTIVQKENGSGITLGPDVLDLGLGALALANKIIVCSSVPTTYAGAVAAKIGEKNLGIGGCFAAIAGYTDGRKRASTAVVSGVSLTSATPAAWAVIDEANSRLLAVGNLSGAVAIDTTKEWALASFTINLPGIM